MAVLPADHLIRDRSAFQSDLRATAKAAEQSGDLITIGIKPTWACPGFGYIEKGAKTYGSGNDLFEVVRFREKPAVDLAESFVRSGNFFWNAGIFIWTVKAILTELNRHVPELGEFVSCIRHSVDLSKILKKRFSSLPKMSINYNMMEKVGQELVRRACFDWNEVGRWTT